MAEKYIFQVEGQEFEIKLKEGIFHPTGTSDEIIKAVAANIDSPGTILDLGCGCGLVGFSLHLLGKSEGTLYASDLSNDAALLIEANARNLGIPVISRQGSIFEPWENEYFDYIVDDISGIAEQVAKISPWFRKTSCRSGEDGTDLVIEAIINSPQHLKSGGKLFFPVLSLSKTEKIIETANSMFTSVTKVAHKQWRLPDEMKENMAILVDLREKGLIQFEEKYGWLLWSSDVYMAESPR